RWASRGAGHARVDGGPEWKLPLLAGAGSAGESKSVAADTRPAPGRAEGHWTGSGGGAGAGHRSVPAGRARHDRSAYRALRRRDVRRPASRSGVQDVAHQAVLPVSERRGETLNQRVALSHDDGHCSAATTLRTRRMPASWSRVRIDSGWNWTAATGSVACSTAIPMPSSLSAGTRSASGTGSRNAKRE